MPEFLQIGVIVFPGMGIQDNLADRPGCSASLFSISAQTEAAANRCPYLVAYFVGAGARATSLGFRRYDHVDRLAKSDDLAPLGFKMSEELLLDFLTQNPRFYRLCDTRRKLDPVS
jgi:hypothetical protein